MKKINNPEFNEWLEKKYGIKFNKAYKKYFCYRGELTDDDLAMKIEIFLSEVKLYFYKIFFYDKKKEYCLTIVGKGSYYSKRLFDAIKSAVEALA